MTALGTVRAEGWTDLECNGGVPFDTGRFIPAHVITATLSLESDTSMTLEMPGTCEAASIVREAQVIRLWESDSDYEEWIIGPTARRLGQASQGSMGATVELTCYPPLYLLGTKGLVTEWDLTPLDGVPIFAAGATLSPADFIQSKILDDPATTALLPWLDLGTMTYTDPIAYRWANVTRLQFLRGLVDAIQATLSPGTACELAPLRRSGTSQYLIDIVAEVGV